MSRFHQMQTRNELADFLAVPRKKLSHLLYVKRIENCYNTFTIPKRSGGEREISAPNEELKSIQKNLAAKLQRYRDEYHSNNGTVPNIAHAFEKKKGIITNARIHRGKRFVVNLDLEDFFGSIHFGRIMGYFEKNKSFLMSHEVATVISQLCCYQGKLPQGAPSSPIISNMICEILDFKLLQIAKKYRLDYTRYADDLTFSTNDKNFLANYDAFYSAVSGAIQHAGFRLNIKKTRLQYRDSRQTVTGLVVNRKISVDHRYYKQTRAMAHHLYCTGEFQINGESGTMEQLEGRFAFINQLDKYDNENCQVKKRDIWTLNGREKEYQKFLFYKVFFANEKPLIITEGKTDILYIKAALKSMYKNYPNLIELRQDGTFDFKFRFLRRTKRLRYFFDLSLDGADTMQKIYPYFTERKGKNPNSGFYPAFSANTTLQVQHPVVLVFDNELNDKNKPLNKFINLVSKDNSSTGIKDKIKTSYCEMIVPKTNLYLVTHQLVDEKPNCEIEDLFFPEVRATIIDGKKLSLREDYDPKIEYGKDTFSKYVLQNYASIDFSRFTTLLDSINSTVVRSLEPANC